MTPRRLTPKQQTALDLLADNPDWTNKDLAGAMGVSVRRIKFLLTGTFVTYGVQSRTAAVKAHLGSRTPPHRRRASISPDQMELETA